jgi:hypothetical protein
MVAPNPSPQKYLESTPTFSHSLTNIHSSFPNPQIDDRPILCFSGAASLWPYYNGVYYYLHHHFDLTQVRASGISMGVNSAMAVALRLRPMEVFEMGLSWSSLIWGRALKCFFMSSKLWCRTGLATTTKYGVTDEQVRTFVSSGTIYSGCTDISVFPPEHVLLADASSTYEALYIGNLSMRIFPFFNFPGFFRKMVLIDGGFTAIWAVPDDANIDKIVRISPFPLTGADISPSFEERFSARDVMYSRYKKQMWNEMKIGYRSAKRAHQRLIGKGLTEIMPEEEDEEEEGEEGGGGRVGSLNHFLTSADAMLNSFIVDDKMKTKWE